MAEAGVREYKLIKRYDIDGNVYWSAYFLDDNDLVGGGNNPTEAIVELEDNAKVLDAYNHKVEEQ